MPKHKIVLHSDLVWAVESFDELPPIRKAIEALSPDAHYSYLNFDEVWIPGPLIEPKKVLIPTLRYFTPTTR